MSILLSLIVPLYNEEKHLHKNIKKIIHHLSKQDYNFELIMINDGSSDATAEVADELVKTDKRLKLISYKKNKGKGHAVRTGLLAGKGVFLAFVDADNSSPIENIEIAISKLKDGADMVIGSRNPADVAGACQSLPQNPLKRTLGICGNKLIKLFLKTKINDTQCGFKVFKNDFVQKILPKTKSKRWALDAEIIYFAEKGKYQIACIPIKWSRGPLSRVGIKGYFLTLYEIFKIWKGDKKIISKINRES